MVSEITQSIRERSLENIKRVKNLIKIYLISTDIQASETMQVITKNLNQKS